MLLSCINNVISKEGDLYDKAAEFLISLVKSHCFESANRRTAVFMTYAFLESNNKKSKINMTKPENAKIMIAIRENRHYSFSDIKNWIKTGKIDEYKRCL